MYGLEATMHQHGIKSFTKALACLAKYGDELSIVASQTDLSLSSTNSSKSAYARIKFYSGFFENYSVNVPDTHASGNPATEDTVEKVVAVRGEVLVKSVLTILRHKNIQETVNKCDIVILEASPEAEDDSPESVFILRLHCKHGVTKTHKLSLNEPDSFLAPRLPSPSIASHSKVVVGPRAVKDLLEHFSGLGKMDAQLNWEFGNVSVKVRSRESGASVKGSHIDTEINVDADEFDVYAIPAPPISLSFHLREFNATIALSESLSLPLNILFTRPGDPLSIEIEADEEEALFIIATSQSGSGATTTSDGGKRKRANTNANADTESSSDTRRKKPARVVEVQRLETTATPRVASSAGDFTPGADPSQGPVAGPSSHNVRRSTTSPTGQNHQQESLFLQPSQPEPSQQFRPPPLSQLSVADAAIIREAGLGIEDMDPDEFAALMDDEGEELHIGPPPSHHVPTDPGKDIDPDGDWNMDTAGTQFPANSQRHDVMSRNGKAFRPFFD